MQDGTQHQVVVPAVCPGINVRIDTIMLAAKNREKQAVLCAL